MKRQSPQLPDNRRAQILGAAVQLARHQRFDTLTRAQIAEAAQVAVGTVSHACGPMRAVRDGILRRAITDNVLEVIADGLAIRNPIARNETTERQRLAALSTLTH